MRVDIPTDQLRALIAVVDFRSYTKAAQFLGLSQPAISAQIKRLQELLELELFDKSTPGVNLSQQGELVINYARRIMAMNDQLLHRLKPIHPIDVLTIGIPSDLVEPLLTQALVMLRKEFPDLKFRIRQDISENLLRDLRAGSLDLVVALTMSEPAVEAHRYWPEEMAWVASRHTKIDGNRPIPLITYTDACVYSRLASAALNKAGLDHDIVFTGQDIVSLVAAVNAGLGVMVLARRAMPQDLNAYTGPLPKLPDLICGIYLREGPERDELARLAHAMGELIHAPRVNQVGVRSEL
jgi:DNA-binding transcriptional LysR family regulator